MKTSSNSRAGTPSRPIDPGRSEEGRLSGNRSPVLHLACSQQNRVATLHSVSREWISSVNKIINGIYTRRSRIDNDNEKWLITAHIQNAFGTPDWKPKRVITRLRFMNNTNNVVSG